MKRSSVVEQKRGVAGRLLAAVAGAVLALGAWAAVQDRAPVAQAVESEGEPKTREETAVNLEIYHGQFGSALSEQDEETTGATTVANKNDTDGDGVVDNVDDTVETTPTTLTAGAAQGATSLQVASVAHFSKGTTVLVRKAGDNWAQDPAKWEVGKVKEIGPGQTLTLAGGLQNGYVAGDLVSKPEVDLMRLVLHKPQGEGGKVRLSKVEGHFKVWKQPIKGTPATHEVTLPVEYTLGELPKTLWVEATETSGELQSIALKMEYPGAVADTVKATAAWCEKTTRKPDQGKNPWLERQDADGFPDNPKVGPRGDLPDLDASLAVKHINQVFLAAGGSRYGRGPCHVSVTGRDERFGGRVLFEFKLLPKDVETLGVTLDPTRQKDAKTWLISLGSKRVEPVPDFTEAWPWAQTPPRDVEEGNDEHPSSVQDRFPTNQLVYSFDGPGIALADGRVLAFAIMRVSFQEWVRVGLEERHFGGADDTVEGSRGSEKTDWHFVMYLKRNGADQLEEDNSGTAPSACAPTFTFSGFLSVTVDATNCDTEGWSVTYDQPNNQWDVKDAGGNNRGTLTFVAGSNPRKWTGSGSIGGKVWLTLAATETPDFPFANGERFQFSTFKSGETKTGKRNAIGTGAFPVDGEAGSVP